MHTNFNVGFVLWLGPKMAAKVNSENGYSNTLNPAVFAEFSTAAFRMGHSQLRSFIRYFLIKLNLLFFFRLYYTYLTFEIWPDCSRETGGTVERVINSQIRSMTPLGS
jgi:hypothetical protein